MVNKVNSLKFTLRFFGRKSFLKDPFRIFQFLVALEYLGQRKLTLINEKPNKIFNKFPFTCFPFYFPKKQALFIRSSPYVSLSHLAARVLYYLSSLGTHCNNRRQLFGFKVGFKFSDSDWIGFCQICMIEVIRIYYVNKAFERLEKNDVRYRVAVDVTRSKLDQWNKFDFGLVGGKELVSITFVWWIVYESLECDS